MSWEEAIVRQYDGRDDGEKKGSLRLGDEEILMMVMWKRKRLQSTRDPTLGLSRQGFVARHRNCKE